MHLPLNRGATPGAAQTGLALLCLAAAWPRAALPAEELTAIDAWRENATRGAQVVPGQFAMRSPGRAWSPGEEGPLSCQVERRFGRNPVYRIQCPPDLPIEQVIAAWSQAPGVDWVEPGYRIELAYTPSDYLTEQWHLENTGQEIDSSWGVAGADICAFDAWDITTGDASIVVAVLDTGSYLSHADLAGQLWQNPAEKCGDGLDDDANGYVDDCYGWDMSSDDDDVEPFSMLPTKPSGDSCPRHHGTFIAGLIGGIGDNGVALPGVAWDVQLMTLKVFDDISCTASTAVEAEAILYAIDNGALAMNMSFGGGSYSKLVESALAAADAAGVLSIMAAGNDSMDLDPAPYYPPWYGAANQIVVAYTDNTDELDIDSNYGETLVDLAAPGEDIYSLDIDDPTDVRTGSGTSYAAPLVVGAAVLVWAAYPGLSAEEVKEAIISGTDPLDSLDCDLVPTCVSSAGRLDLVGALDWAAAIDGSLPILAYAGSEGLDDGTGDSSGDGDGDFEPGETVELWADVLNQGYGDAADVVGDLSTSATDLTLSRSSVEWGSIAMDALETSSEGFLVQVSGSCTTDSTAELELTLEDSTGVTWTAQLELPLLCTLGPDLAVSSLSVVGSGGAAGDALSLSYLVENLGDRESGAYAASVRFSADTTIDASDAEACAAAQASLPAGAASSVSWSTCSVPTIVAGSYYVGVIVDDGDDIDELDENNNTAYDPVPYVVSAASSPLLAYASHSIDDDSSGASNGDGDGLAEVGESIEMGLEVENLGTDQADDVVATISTSAALITITDTQESLGDIAAGATASTASSRDFDFEVDAACSSSFSASFDLELEDSSGTTWSDSFEVEIWCAFDDDADGYDSTEDCDDGDAAVNPGATESCNGLDDDCDGDTDEDDASDASAWYLDADGDGFGDAGQTATACYAPGGYVTDSSDCVDADSPAHPGATEICDGMDNDCDGALDEADAADAATWYADTDGDGYGDPAVAQSACSAPTSHVADATDCDDANQDVHPQASEHCDGVDEDCDGAIDEEAVDQATWYADQDGDGWGDEGSSQQACEEPAEHVALAGDCDDLDELAWPDNQEVCDGSDNDCDGTTDGADAADAQTWYADEDGDGFGDPDNAQLACEAPAGWTDNGEDCDDTLDEVRPGAEERCNQLDDDCDGEADIDAVDAVIWYPDQDGDGYGVTAEAYVACDPEEGGRTVSGDCDDLDPDTYPDAVERCDGHDDDCDGEVDEEAIDMDTWYRDADGDGYGDAAHGKQACDQPAGHVANGDDPDDGDAAVYPGSRPDSCGCAAAGQAPEGTLAGLLWLGAYLGFRRRRGQPGHKSLRPLGALGLLLAGLAPLFAPQAVAAVPILASAFEPTDKPSVELAGRMPQILTAQVAALPEFQLIDLQDVPNIGDLTASAYLENCPPGQAAGCAVAVGQAASASYALAGTVRSLDILAPLPTIDVLLDDELPEPEDERDEEGPEQELEVTLLLLEVQDYYELLSVVLTYTPSTEESFASSVRLMLQDAKTGLIKRDKDIRDPTVPVLDELLDEMTREDRAEELELLKREMGEIGDGEVLDSYSAETGRQERERCSLEQLLQRYEGGTPPWEDLWLSARGATSTGTTRAGTTRAGSTGAGAGGAAS